MRVIEADGIFIYSFVWIYIDSNAYIVLEGDSALVVDPVDTEEFWQFVEEKRIQTMDVILTHEHFDHISGLNKLRKIGACTVYAQRSCSENIGIQTRNLSSAANVLAQINESVQKKGISVEAFVCEPAEVVFDKAYTFFWKGHKVELVSTPGHSAGSICVVLDEKWLFSGDTLLDVPTITRLPGGDKRILQEITLPWIEKKMRSVKWILPGHGDGWESAKEIKRERYENTVSIY